MCVSNLLSIFNIYKSFCGFQEEIEKRLRLACKYFVPS